MTGDVNNPPWALLQRVQHRQRIRARLRCIIRADERRDLVLLDAARLEQLLHHRACFVASADESGITGRTRRFANHEDVRVGARVHHLIAERIRAQLAQQLGANGPWLATAATGVGIEQFPGNACGAVVKFQQHFRGATEERLHLHGHEQVEKRAPDARIRIQCIRCGGHQLAHECHLH